MRNTKTQRTANFYDSMARLGFGYDEANKLRLIEKTLHRWCELECGDGNSYASWAIERDEETEKPYMIRHVYAHGNGQDRMIRTPVADREKGAIKRLEAILSAHPELTYYYQTDPRGCALYLLHQSDIVGPIDSCYSRGFGVCID